MLGPRCCLPALARDRGEAGACILLVQRGQAGSWTQASRTLAHGADRQQVHAHCGNVACEGAEPQVAAGGWGVGARDGCACSFQGRN